MGTILMLNLLIAMMASTYDKRLRSNKKDMNFNDLVEINRLKHSMALLGPPLNIVMYFLFLCIEGICRLPELISCKTVVLDICRLLPIDIDFHRDDGVGPSLQATESTLSLRGKEQRLRAAMFCQHCRRCIIGHGDIKQYFKLITSTSYRLDHDEQQMVQRLLSKKGLCPNCYRSFKFGYHSLYFSLYAVIGF